MKIIALTGATGFIGRHVLEVLKGLPDTRIVCLGRNENALKALGEDYQVFDLDDRRTDLFERSDCPDVLIHLAWERLPNYDDLVHVEQNLPNHMIFLKSMIERGLPSLTVSGTCFEYGLLNGLLSEDMPTQPTTCYGLAKDTLRRYLEMLGRVHRFELRWMRLFFVYGPGQNPGSLLPSLDRAIDSGAESFDLTTGEQLRDFSPVRDLAERLVRTALQRRHLGLFNLCSGRPMSVRRLVERHVFERGAGIRLNFGARGGSIEEPPAFWGDTRRVDLAVQAYGE